MLSMIIPALEVEQLGNLHEMIQKADEACEAFGQFLSAYNVNKWAGFDVSEPGLMHAHHAS